MAKRKYVRVTWLDSCTTDTWHRRGEVAYEALKCVTVGWVVEKTKRALTLAQSENEGGQLLGVITIPRSCVTRIETMKVEKK